MNFDYKPLNLGQGLPDDLIPQYVIDTLAEVMKEPVSTNNQYTRGFVSHNPDIQDELLILHVVHL